MYVQVQIAKLSKAAWKVSVGCPHMDSCRKGDLCDPSCANCNYEPKMALITISITRIQPESVREQTVIIYQDGGRYITTSPET